MQATQPSLLNAMLQNPLLQEFKEVMGLADIPLPTLRARYETAHSRYLNLHGMSVHYADEGEGPVLILLHGIMASLHTWDGWVEALRGHYRIIRLDLPGFGLTGQHPQRRYHPADYVEFLEAFRSALGIEQFHLAGNSLGGAIAWLYTRHHPQRVDKLVLANPGGYQMPIQSILKLVVHPGAMRAVRHALPRFLITVGVRDVYGNPDLIRAGTIRRYHELFLRPGNRRAMADVAKTLVAMNHHGQLETEIKHLHNPTLLLWGDLDRWIPPAHVERWQADLPHVEIKVYKGVGHIPMEEIPARSAEDVQSFLTRQ